MPAWAYLWLARLIMAGHVAFMVAVAASWRWPLTAQLSLYGILIGVTVIGHIDYGGRCPITLLEFRLRRRAGYNGRSVGLMRRLLLCTVSEYTASRIAYGIALASLLAGLIRAAI